MTKVRFGTRQLNALLDSTLMDKYKFASETLMQLAGLAVAQVTDQILKPKAKPTVCILVGPGNNGGDGLVAARHLKMMNYEVDVLLFKHLEGKNSNYHKLCLLNQIPSKFIDEFLTGDKDPEIEHFENHLAQRDLLIDGIFGFPFKGQMRAPYKLFFPSLSKFEDKILSIDIPSGWDADEGNIKNVFTPKYLISLGIPKLCSQNFKGLHYVGGRFIPKQVQKELNIELPDFKGAELYCKLQ